MQPIDFLSATTFLLLALFFAAFLSLGIMIIHDEWEMWKHKRKMEKMFHPKVPEDLP